MVHFTPAEKFELAAIPVAVALTGVLTRGRTLPTEFGYVIAGGALVVFLLVELYKLGGARSSTILCQAGWKST